MKIVVFSDDARVKKLFSGITKVAFRPAPDLAAAARAPEPALCYIDLSTCAPARVKAFLKAAAETPGLQYGLIDPAGKEADPAMHLLSGARDYLGPALCKKPLSPARLQAVCRAAGAVRGRAGAPDATPTGEPEAVSAAPRARDWQDVTSGNEYLFRMLFIGLDGHKDLNVRVAESALGRILAYFQKQVEACLAPSGGRLWIWTDYSGIALFPFKAGTDDLVAACLRLMFARRIISVDQSIQKMLLSYRMALVTGSTVYHERGKTGRIISDAVNSLSHIGSKFAKPGSLYLSRDLHEELSPSLAQCFAPAGTFEGSPLLRLRPPVAY